MEIRVSEIIAAFVVLLLGAFILVSLLFGVMPHNITIPEALSFPGELFFSSFSYCAFYIPVYLILCGFLFVSGKDYRKPIGFLSFLYFPVVTLGLGLHFILDTALHPFLSQTAEVLLSRKTAFLFFFIAALIELLFILIKYFERKSGLPAVTEVLPESARESHTVDFEESGESSTEDDMFEDDFELPDMPELPPLRTAAYREGEDSHLELTRDSNGDLTVRGRSADVSKRDETRVEASDAALEEDDLLELDSQDESDELEVLDDAESSAHGTPERPGVGKANTGAPSRSAVSEEEIVKEGPQGANKELYESGNEVEGLVQQVLSSDYEVIEEEGSIVQDEELEEIEELTAEYGNIDGDLEEIAEAEDIEELSEIEDLEDFEELAEEDIAETKGYDDIEEEFEVPEFDSSISDGHEVIIEQSLDDFDGQDIPEDMELSLEYEEDKTALDPASIVIDPKEIDDQLEDDEDDYDSDLLEDRGAQVLQEELMEEPEKKKTSYDDYTVPVDSLLKKYGNKKYWIVDKSTKEAGETLRRTLEEFKIEAEVTGIRKGPVITMYEILPAPGVKLSKITNLADNIALRLAASSVRIVAPIPGKHAVGIEVPNHDRAIVSFHEMINDEKFSTSSYEIPVILGKDITGGSQIIELTQTPHLLIAGATGSGKSVCVNSLISTILCSKTPDEVRLMLIDPKIVELKLYNDIPHLLTPVITEPKKAFQALQYCLYEMERRYSLLDSQGVRDIKSYNKKIKMKRLATAKLPYIVVIVDEFADLMATTGKELESVLARLAAMARAVGIHLVLATQRPSIDVITGLIKANIPSRIAFMVAGKFDSRIILDAVGAEKLLGRGDMLFTSAWDPQLTRIQGAFLSEEEVGKIVSHVKTLGEPEYIDDEIFIDEDDMDSPYLGDSANDPLMDKAVEIVTSAGKASASYLQRRLKIGYNRAARLVEDMEARGIVGPQNGSKPREILHIP